MTEIQADNTIGRPTKYKPEYCTQVVEFMGQGYSLTAFAAEIEVARDTVYEWESAIPDFSDAIKRARDARVRCLEKSILNTELSPVVTSRIFMLKCAAKHEYNENSEIKELLNAVSKLTRTVIDNAPGFQDPA